MQEEMRSYAARLRMFGYPPDAGEVATRLARWADALAQRTATTHGRATSRRVTPQLAAEVRRYAVDHPGTPQHVIATVFGINQGRVSEVLAGKRT